MGRYPLVERNADDAVVAPGEVKAGFFYGWIICISATLAYFFTNGVAYYLPQNLFPRLMEEFGVSVSAISIAGALTFMVGGISAPIVGWLID
ncbi:MAG: hypothetical protein RIC38_01110, partial [Chromatocurvus sp.]